MMNFFRRHIIWANFIIVCAEIVVAILIWFSGGWFFAGSVVTFGQLHNYGFIWLSIVIATIAAINSVFATTMASDTQRPYLAMSSENIVPRLEDKKYHIFLYVENFGNLPARNIETEMQFFDSGEKIDKSNTSKAYRKLITSPSKPVIFPQSNSQFDFFIENDNSNIVPNLLNGRLSARLVIRYDGLGKKHLTVQAMKLPKKDEGVKLAIQAIRPHEFI